MKAINIAIAITILKEYEAEDCKDIRNRGYDTDKNTIHGFMQPLELHWLYAKAKEMDSVVEIGSWKGRSAHALLSGCKGKVFCVDNFKGNKGDLHGEHKEVLSRDISVDFLKNVRSFPNMVLMQTDSIKAANSFANKSVDMVFIDGDHEEASVYQDIMAWMPKAKKMVCGHDFDSDAVKSGIVRALVENKIFKFRCFPETSIWEVAL
jgi:predicted O-methyltransferase YrrM